MRRRLGFTLTEILIVIGIVALLSAIAFPVILQVRARSRRTTCQSSLHQVYLALHQYVEDNDATWPEANIWGKRSFTTVHLNGCPQAIPATRPVGMIGIEGYAYNTALSPGHNIGINDQAIRYPSTTVAICEQAIGRYLSYGPDPNHNTTQEPYAGEELGWLRHNGGANYLFVDGHVKWYLPDAVGYNDEKKNVGTFPTFSVGIPDKH